MNRRVIITLAAAAAAVAVVATFVARNEPRPERPAVEAEAAGRLRSYARAQQEFHAAKGRYGAIEELRGANLVGQEWAASMSLGPYHLEFEVAHQGRFFHARAEPWGSQAPLPYFYVDSSSRGRVHYSDHGMAGPKDPYYESE